MSYGINSSRFKQIEIEFTQELERRSKETSAVDVSHEFQQPKMPEPLPHCPQCGAAHASGAKRCKRCRTNLVRTIGGITV